MIRCRVQPGTFDVAAECASLRAGRTDIGALVTFTGIVRDHSLLLEHYAGMAEAELRAIAEDAARRWPVLGGTIIHRHGPLMPGEEIVLVAIASAARSDAFNAAQFLMDWLKTKAPFWKREGTGDAARWVDARSSDEIAAAKWKTRD